MITNLPYRVKSLRPSLCENTPLCCRIKVHTLLDNYSDFYPQLLKMAVRSTIFDAHFFYSAICIEKSETIKPALVLALTYQTGKGEKDKNNKNHTMDGAFQHVGLAVGKVDDGGQKGNEQQNHLHRTQDKVNFMMGEQGQHNHGRNGE